jgi:hypothetical protein
VADRRDRQITIRGAREHNLKGIDLEIPRGRLTPIFDSSADGVARFRADLGRVLAPGTTLWSVVLSIGAQRSDESGRSYAGRREGCGRVPRQLGP